MPVELRALSLGAGVQSSALYLMAVHGEFGNERPDVAIFADTQWEPKDVYGWLDEMERIGGAVFDERAGEWHQPILDSAVLRDEFEQSVEGDDEPEDTPPKEIAKYALDEFVNRGGLVDVFRKTISASRSPSGADE